MTEYIARTRIWLRNASYLLAEPFDEVLDKIRGGEDAVFTSLTGQAAFPPERIWFAVGEVLSVQECSPESWVWQQHADEVHYARQIQDLGQSPAERQVAAQERLADAISNAHGDGDDE
jgi:hypothetical protein